MPSPLLLGLRDPGLLARLTASLAERGRAHHLAADGAQLLEEVAAGSDVVVDPGMAPAAETPESFVRALVARAEEGRVFALAGGVIDEDALIDLGVADVFHAETSPRVLVRRVAGRVARTAARPAENAGSGHSDADALHGFKERVAVRLSRARDRERAVALFCVSARGGLGDDAREAFLRVLEGVLEDLDRTDEMSYTASRIAIAPLGDDLYAVLVPDVERVQDAARLAVRFHEAMETQVGVVTHVGVACSPDDGTTPGVLIERARAAAARARGEGENHVEFFSESMSRWAFERLTLEQSLRNALKNEELVVYYQPRIDIESREIIGMEALVRWIHPQFGLVSPGQFIPLAEETGLIVPIGDWILREACRQNAEWRAAGLPRVRVSVNLSPIQFTRPDLHESVVDALSCAGLDADGLELEVTESLLMNDPAETASVLGRLQSEGIHISIDDFGTGYSSLSYLKRFPINALKIDRSFVTDVTSNPDDAAIATAIILMGHSLKLTVVAEGVETENQLEFLKVLQCNEVQGYLFSPPVPADRARDLLAKQVGAFARDAA